MADTKSEAPAKAVKPVKPGADGPSKRDAGPRPDPTKRGQLFAAVAVAAMLPLLAYVVLTSGQRTETGETRDPLDPRTTNESELRRVHEAVSRVLTAAPSAMAAAVETLESVRADSPGARDLKDSCVSTYRGLLNATGATQTARSLLMLPDGGERPEVELGMEDRMRAASAMRTATEQHELVTQSHERCHSLYGQASERLHLEPAQRMLRR